MERHEAKKLSLFVRFQVTRVLEGWAGCTVTPPIAFVAQDTAEVMKIATFFVSFFLFISIYPRFLLFFVVFSRFGSIIGVGTHPKLFHTIFSNLGTMVHTKKTRPKTQNRDFNGLFDKCCQKDRISLRFQHLDPGSPRGQPGVTRG